MQLTLFTDYVLRTLLFLGAHAGETVSASAISEAYGVSSDHMAKAAKWLTQRGYVTAFRGKSGGLRLACDPSAVNIGKIVRETEPNLDLVECFNVERNRCPLTPVCKLKGALHAARSAFFAVLDEYTLEALLEPRGQLVSLLRRGV